MPDSERVAQEADKWKKISSIPLRASEIKNGNVTRRTIPWYDGEHRL